MQLIDLAQVRREIGLAGGLSIHDALKLVDELEHARSRMGTAVEVYPLAVDPDTRRIWVLEPGGAWCSDPVQSDSEPDDAAMYLLLQHGALDLQRGVKHQTSCRTEITEETGRSFQVDTFLAAVPLDGPILARWPHAEPITEALLAELGPPEPHGPMEVPWVDDGDVLLHGLGVLKELMGDSPRSDPKSGPRLVKLGFREPLETTEEQMFKHFRRVHQAA
jgi:hypothetical protein